MKFKAKQIAQLLEGRLVGDPNTEINNISGIESGSQGDISFLANEKYEKFIYETNCSVVIVNESFKPKNNIKATLLYVTDAYQAFTKLLVMAQEKDLPKGISKKSIQEKGSTLGKNVAIGHFSTISQDAVVGENTIIFSGCHIGKRVKIGKNCLIYPNVVIFNDCVIGDNCIIHSSTVIGCDGFGHAPQDDGSFKKIPQLGNVIIGNNVEIGSNTSIDRATMGSTIIEDGVKIDNLVQIAHNVVIKKNTVMAGQAGVAGSTTIGESCMIAGQVGFSGHITIANKSKFGGQAGINASIEKEGGTYMGSPIVSYLDFMKQNVFLRNYQKTLTRLQALEKKIKQLENYNNL